MTSWFSFMAGTSRAPRPAIGHRRFWAALQITLAVHAFGIERPLFAQQTDGFVAEVAALKPKSPPSVFVQESPWTPAYVGQQLRAGARIRTDHRGRAVILLTDETKMELNTNSELVLRASKRVDSILNRLINVGLPVFPGPPESLLRLVAGELFVDLDRSPADLTILTDSANLRTRHTEFVVRADQRETVVTVLQGTVEVENLQVKQLVQAGQQCVTQLGQPPGQPIRVQPDNAVQWTFFYFASLSPRDYPFQNLPPGQALQAAQSESRPVLKAELLFDAGETEAALLALEGATGTRANEVRGWIYLTQNRIQEALTQLQAAEPASPRVRLALSMAHWRLGEVEAAYQAVETRPTGILLLQKSLLELNSGKVAAARKTLEEVDRGDPHYGLSRGLLSTILLTQNQQESAWEAAQAASLHAPASPTAWLTLSRVQQSRFDLKASARSVQKALDLDPGFTEARIQQAVLLFGEGRNAKAEQEVRKVLESSPREATAHSLLGFILLAGGKTSEAQVSFQKAVDLDSTLSEPRLGLALVDFRRGQTTEAAVRVLEAVAIDPRVSLYQSYLAKAFYEQRFSKEALAALERAKELDPLDPTPYLYGGIFLEDLNQPGHAVKAFRESIRLNDNRAVYRSRLLLDQDLATRNVRLAEAYRRLGLSDQAELEAVKSNLADLTVSSAHLFLADAYLNLPGRTSAAGSESLLARLLIPVNANSFNSFNDYTTLLERPRFNWTAEGSYGSFDTASGTLSQSGGAVRYAYGSSFFFDRTAGFRTENDDFTSYTTTNFFKFAPTPDSDLLLTYSFDQGRGGAPGSVFAGQVADLEARSFSRIHRAELGYHWRHRKGSEVVVLLSGRDADQVIDELEVQTAFGAADSRFVARTPNVNLQGAHLFKWSDFQIRYGFDLFEGRISQQETLRFPDPRGGGIIFDPSETLRRDVNFQSFFFQTDYAFNPRLVLTGGVSYDLADVPLGALDRLEFRDNRFQASRWNPRAGALYTPTPDTTLRFAFAQTLRTHGQESLAPAHIDGFPLLQNEPELSAADNHNFAWDQDLGDKTFLRATAFRRDRDTPAALFPEGNLAVVQVGRDSYGGRLVLNRLLTDRFSFSTEYSFFRSEDRMPVGDEFIRGSLRRNHEARVSLFYIHPRGLFLEVSQNFLHQRGRVEGSFSEGRIIGGVETGPVHVFNTDVSISYEFPEKIGLASFAVRNLFDDRDDFLIDPLAPDIRLPQLHFEFQLRLNF